MRSLLLSDTDRPLSRSAVGIALPGWLHAHPFFDLLFSELRFSELRCCDPAFRQWQPILRLPPLTRGLAACYRRGLPQSRDAVRLFRRGLAATRSACRSSLPA